jgi:hypothetical protein
MSAPTYTPLPADAKLQDTKIKIEEVQQTMRTNIDAVIERGEQLGPLEEKSKNLSEQSSIFKRKSRTLKCRTCWQSYKPLLIGLIIVVVIILLLYFSLKT